MLIAVLLTIHASAASAQVTAIRAWRVVDPDAGTTAQNQVILVENGRITAIGGNVAILTGANGIDLSMSTISPGLVDAHTHTHLCLGVQERRDAGSYYLTTLRDPDAMRAIQGVVNARTMLQAGFTTVRDIGNEGNYACVQVRRAIEAGLIVGPTMITAGRIIAPYGGQFHLQPDKRALAEPEYFFADTPDEMVKGVREHAHYGATVIKSVIDDQPYLYSTVDATRCAQCRRGRRRAHRIGVRLVYGTDAISLLRGTTRGADAMTGIDPWVDAGIPASAILTTMTTDATRLLGSVSFVMKDGRVVGR